MKGVLPLPPRREFTRLELDGLQGLNLLKNEKFRKEMEMLGAVLKSDMHTNVKKLMIKPILESIDKGNMDEAQARSRKLKKAEEEKLKKVAV